MNVMFYVAFTDGRFGSKTMLYTYLTLGILSAIIFIAQDLFLRP